MKTVVLALGVFALAVTAVTSCTTFQASGLQMGSRDTNYQVVGDFETKVWVHKFLGTSGGPTLFNIGAEVTENAIQQTVMTEVQARGGTAAINVRIKYGSNPAQWFLNYLTWNIWAPATVTVSGTVIKE